MSKRIDADVLVEFEIGDVCKFINPHIEGNNEEFIILNFYGLYENHFQYVSVYGLTSKKQFNTNVALIKKAIAIEPQESIFDADGWCWDMDLAPENENVILYIVNPDLKTKRATTGMRIGKEFYFARVSERDRPIAWKPLTLPKDKL